MPCCPRTSVPLAAAPARMPINISPRIPISCIQNKAPSAGRRRSLKSCFGTRLLLLAARRGVDRGLRPLGELFLELVVVVIGDVQPRVAHLVNRSIAPADPLIRIRVRLVVLRVVVPGEEVEDR